MKKSILVLITFFVAMLLSSFSFASTCTTCDNCQTALENGEYVYLLSDIVDNDTDDECILLSSDADGATLDCTLFVRRSITNDGDAGRSAINIVGANNVTIRDCDFYDWGEWTGVGVEDDDHSQAAIRLWNTDNSLITNNYIENGRNGIILTGNSSNQCHWNDITYNEINTPSFIGIAFWDYSYGNEMSHNVVYDDGSNKTHYGLSSCHDAYSNDIYYNEVTDVTRWGICLCSDSATNEISYNVVSGADSYDILESDTSQGNWGDNNTCDDHWQWRDNYMRSGCRYHN